MASEPEPRRVPAPLALFLASALIRALVLWAVAGTPAVFDETSYVERAEGLRGILAAWLDGRSAPAETRAAAYGGGTWPPLHPALVALGLSLGGLTGARALIALVSALTTPLIWLLARRASGPRAALVAGALHALHPSFVGFSHLLWSETTFVFLLVAAALALQGTPGEGAEGRLGSGRAALAGALLGLAGLVRSAVLPLLVLVPLWTLVRGRGRGRLARPGLILATALAVLAPWLGVLAATEGRFVPLSNTTGFNFYLGNNPWVPAGHGSAWAFRPVKQRVAGAIRARESERGVAPGVAARQLALEEIGAAPGTFVRRSGERLAMLWTLDGFLLRHVLGLVYPPLSSLAAGLAWLLLALVPPLVAAAGLLGLAARAPPLRDRGLLAVLMIGCTLPPLLSIATPRLNLPVLALLLPAAGHGLAHPLQGGRRIALAVGAGVLVLAGILATTPLLLTSWVVPSGHYAPLLRALGPLAGRDVPTLDHVLVRSTGDSPVAVEIEASAGARIALRGMSEDPVPAARIAAPPGGITLELHAAGSAPGLFLRGKEGAPVSLLMRGEDLRRWRASVEGAEVLWTGAVAPP